MEAHKGINIFIISSDKTLIGKEGIGDAPARHAEYGKKVDSIDILVYTKKSEGLKTLPISSNVRGLPSNSLSKATFFFDALRIFKKANREHKINLIVAQDPFILGFVGWWLKKKYKVKLVINFHGDFWNNKFWLRERLLNPFFILLSYFVVPRCDAVRVESIAIKEKLRKKGVTNKIIEVFTVAINSQNFELANTNKVSEIRKYFGNKKSIIFVGRLHKVKNLSFLIKSFALVKKQFEDSNLILIGEGPEKKNLRSLVRKLGLGTSVFFLGLVDYRELVNYYHAADLLILPSFSEGLPKVLIEGGLCGLPLLATDASWSRETIEDNSNGFLIPLNNQKVFVERLILLLENDSLREKMSVNSRLLAQKYLANRKDTIVQFWKRIISE